MVYDLPYPCPEYDLRATEAWLERKAAKGRILLSGGNLAGFAAFEKAQPQTIRYRLVPVEDVNFFTPEHKQPSAEALELYRQMGWEYITNRGMFHICASHDPDAPEPDTDPHVLALALKPIVVQAAATAIFSLILAAIWVFGYHVFYTAVSRNTPGWLLVPVPYVILALSKLGSCIRLIRYRRTCRSGHFPAVRTRFFLPDNMILLTLMVLVIIGFVSAGDDPSQPSREIYDNYVLHGELDGTLPFPDAASLFPETSVTDCTTASYRTFATRENWSYYADFTLPGGQNGSIRVDYAVFPLPALANWYAWELENRSQPEDLILCRDQTVIHIDLDDGGIHTEETLTDLFLNGKE